MEPQITSTCWAVGVHFLALSELSSSSHSSFITAAERGRRLLGEWLGEYVGCLIPRWHTVDVNGMVSHCCLYVVVLYIDMLGPLVLCESEAGRIITK